MSLKKPPVFVPREIRSHELLGSSPEGTQVNGDYRDFPMVNGPMREVWVGLAAELVEQQIQDCT